MYLFFCTPETSLCSQSTLSRAGIFDDEGVQPIHRACTFAEGDGGVLRALLDDPRVSVNNPCPGKYVMLMESHLLSSAAAYRVFRCFVVETLLHHCDVLRSSISTNEPKTRC